MLNPVVGEKVEWRTFTGVFTGTVTAIIDRKRILVGRQIVWISELTAIIG